MTMQWIQYAIDLVLHLDKHLAELTSSYGLWVYLFLFLIVFCETGLVVTPFLPGDSLLFAVGALCAKPETNLNVLIAFGILLAAGVLGDTVNYHIGQFIGPKAFTGKYRWLKKEHLEKTHQYFEKYGGKAIILARFVPIVRTFAPFVAGIGAMTYRKFIVYNVIGALLWVGIILFAGYFFGTIPVVERNFSLVVLGIIIISLLPMAIDLLNNWRQAKSQRKDQA